MPWFPDIWEKPQPSARCNAACQELIACILNKHNRDVYAHFSRNRSLFRIASPLTNSRTA